MSLPRLFFKRPMATSAVLSVLPGLKENRTKITNRITHTKKLSTVSSVSLTSIDWTLPPIPNERRSIIQSIVRTLANDATFSRSMSVLLSQYPSSILNADGANVAQRQNYFTIGGCTEWFVLETLNKAFGPTYARKMPDDQKDYDLMIHGGHEIIQLSVKFVSTCNVILKNNMIQQKQKDLTDPKDQTTHTIEDTLIVWVEDKFRDHGCDPCFDQYLCYDPDRNMCLKRDLVGNKDRIAKVDQTHSKEHQKACFNQQRYRSYIVYIPKEYMTATPNAILYKDASVNLDGRYLKRYVGLDENQNCFVAPFSCKKDPSIQPVDYIQNIAHTIYFS